MAVRPDGTNAGLSAGHDATEPASDRVTGVDADIDLLFALVAALRELADDPRRVHDSPRVYAFSIRWGALVFGRLERLAYYHGRGELTGEEKIRYDLLRGELRDAVPQMRQLGLARPAVPLDEAEQDSRRDAGYHPS